MKFTTAAALISVLALAACKEAPPPAPPEPAPVKEAAPEPAEPEGEAEPEPEPEPAPAITANLKDTLTKQGGATKFLEAIETAGLGDYLTGRENLVTLIVPTDAAWDAMPKALKAKSAKKEELAKILRYHIVPSKMDLNRVMQHRGLPTVLGPEIPIEVKEGTKLYFGKANLVTSDIEASNGMAHIIDQVLDPAAKK
jgi:uncharacterized surface protein with fasciclin (FAS1) repeats